MIIYFLSLAFPTAIKKSTSFGSGRPGGKKAGKYLIVSITDTGKRATNKKVVEENEEEEKVLKCTETVLLVDDEEMIINVGKLMLEEMGYRVLVAQTGQKALSLCRKEQSRIDIVILDIIMPDMGGGQTYDRLKEINPHIKVLLSSGYSIDGEASEILGRGCNGIIQKTFSIKQLSREIRNILDHTQA